MSRITPTGTARIRSTSLYCLFTLIALGACGAQQHNEHESVPRTDTTLASDTAALSPTTQTTTVITEASDAALPHWYQRPTSHDHYVNLPLQFITTSTGKRLSARVTLPANDRGSPAAGPFPVILVQSAYNTNLMSTGMTGLSGLAMLGVPDPFLIKRGYALVAVDALGTGASEGSWELLGAEEQLGFAEAVDWVEQQPWSNGKIGVAGVSYMGISSLYAAQQRPDSIDAVFASLPMGDAMRGTVGIGGLLNGVFMAEWMTITHNLSTQNFLTALLNPSHMRQLLRTTREHIDQIEAFHLPMINAALDNDPRYNFDGEFWRTRSPIENMHKIKAPTVIIGALHDIFQRDYGMLYEILRDNGVDARLFVHDGTHVINFLTQHVGNQRVPPVDSQLLQWFDKHLRGMDSGTEQIPPVTQFVKHFPTDDSPGLPGYGSYITAADWPHPAVRAERWYLHGDGSLSQSQPDHREPPAVLTNPDHPTGTPQKKGAFLAFDVELNDGTACSRSFQQWTLGLTFPQSCFSNTNNTEQQRVIFETEPMLEDYFINGPIQADIWIDSSVTEAVLAVQIEEVSSKRASALSNGQLLASKRAVNVARSRFLDGEMIQPYHYFTQEKSQPLVPGEVTKLSVEIFPTSALIRKGNRLRVAISPSNQAQAMLNYPLQAAAEGGVTTIHIAPEYPSSVVLPVVPVGAIYRKAKE